MNAARPFIRFVQFGLVLIAVATCVAPAVASMNESPGTAQPSANTIARAQARLLHDGYLKAGAYSTGAFDPATTAALERFQADHFVPANGELDSDSIALLTTHARIGGSLPAGTTQSESLAGTRQRSVPQEEETVTLAARATVQQGSGRTMPVTGGSPLPAIMVGVVLLATGIALLRRRF